MKKTLFSVVADSFCAGLLVPKTRFNRRTTTRSTENGVGRPGESVGRKRESIGGTGEIGRETESCSSSSTAPQRRFLLSSGPHGRSPGTEREQRMQERLAERQRKMEEIHNADGCVRQRLPPQNKLFRRVRRLRQSNSESWLGALSERVR